MSRESDAEEFSELSKPSEPVRIKARIGNMAPVYRPCRDHMDRRPAVWKSGCTRLFLLLSLESFRWQSDVWCPTILKPQKGTEGWSGEAHEVKSAS